MMGGTTVEDYAVTVISAPVAEDGGAGVVRKARRARRPRFASAGRQLIAA
jgi:hypothetical protein